MMINKDASPETIAKYENNLNNITQALKMRGVSYKLIEGGIIFKVNKFQYTYSVTRRKWRRDTVEIIKGEGLTDLLSNVDKERGPK